MSNSKTQRFADGALVSGAGLLGAASTIDLPTGLDQLSEPIGLVLALIGAAIKLFSFFQNRK